MRYHLLGTKQFSPSLLTAILPISLVFSIPIIMFNSYEKYNKEVTEMNKKTQFNYHADRVKRQLRHTYLLTYYYCYGDLQIDIYIIIKLDRGMDCLRNALLVMGLMRLTQVFVDYNYEHPDQYWQGTEIAYKIARGYGFQTWEWTMQEPIRNGIYQKYLSFAYQISAFINFSPYWTEKMIKIFQIALACIGDYFFLLLLKRYTKTLSLGTCLIVLTNHYYFSMLNRTYSNSVEAILSIIAFYYWTSRAQSKDNDGISRSLVILCFVVRPTSIVLWAVVWIYELMFVSADKVRFIVKNLRFIVMLAGLNVFMNSWWYGKLTFVELNFFNYNIILKWSSLYGVNPFLYYFYATIPFILGLYLLPFIYSMLEYLPHFKTFFSRKIKEEADKNEENKTHYIKVSQNHLFCELFLITFVSLVILSFSTHKQHRFLMILTPFLLILSVKGIESLRKNNVLLILLLVINAGMFLSLNVYGKTGGVQLLRQIREDIHANHREQIDKIALIYLCEPHSLPLFSILQTNITARIIDTSPMRKLTNFNEQIALLTSPLDIFQELTLDLAQKSILYVVIQQKYAMKGSVLNSKYDFMLRNRFNIMSIQNKMNIFQQNLMLDRFILLKSQ